MKTPDPSTVPALSRESWIVRILSGTVGDLKVAVRRLGRDRLFTATALLTLALCIGANTAIFSMVYALVLKPLPFPAPNRIVEINNNFPKAGLNNFPCNLTQYTDFKANTTSFEALGLFAQNTVMVGDPGSAERVDEEDATAEIFDVLGIKPIIGQFFTLANSHPGEDKVVVLTESFWKSHFNGDPAVLDKPIRINEETYRIIGVAPRALEAFNARIKFVRPIAWKPESVVPQMRYSCNLPLYARLKPGVPASQGLEDVGRLEQRFYDKPPAGFRDFLDRTGHKISVTLVQTRRVQPIKASLYLLEGGVIFVLLIGCVNVANLMLARANGQQSELAIRAALGAGRAAIARQLLVESLVLTLGGALLGGALAYGGVHAINQFTVKLLPNMLPIAIDAGVLWYAIGISIVMGLLIGIIPVIHILRSNLSEVLHRSSRSASGGRRVRLLSSVLVTGQIAVALVLLSGAGLLIHSFANAIAVNPGFEPQNLVVGSIALPSAYGPQDKMAVLQRRLVQGMKEIAGVDDAALATGIPFEGNLGILALNLRDGTLPHDAPQPGAFLVGVSIEYFRTLHIQLLEGRLFEETDTVKDARQAFVVDERFAQKYFAGRSAVGGHFTFDKPPDKEGDWPVIVGVVRFVPHNGVEDKSGNPYVYYPLAKTPWGGTNIFVRTGRPVADVISAIREKLRTIDLSIPLFETGTVQKAIDESFNGRRAVMILLGGFAALALFLSAIGIYGVLAYDVSQRTREIGIRGAIGATREQIVGMVMRQGLWKTGIGLVIGVAGALVLGHFMVSMLFEVKPTDPWAYVLVSFLLAAVAATASYLPARRAARIDPIEALRIE